LETCGKVVDKLGSIPVQSPGGLFIHIPSTGSGYDHPQVSSVLKVLLTKEKGAPNKLIHRANHYHPERHKIYI
jgi:hypothetical protein